MPTKKEKRFKRHKRIKAKVFGSAQRPRLCVFRSSKSIYAQLIDDEKGKTVVSAYDKELSGKKNQAKTDKARAVGTLLAKKAKEAKIEKVVFDRGGYKYHGRVKALAEGAREGGLKF